MRIQTARAIQPPSDRWNDHAQATTCNQVAILEPPRQYTGHSRGERIPVAHASNLCSNEITSKIILIIRLTTPT